MAVSGWSEVARRFSSAHLAAWPVAPAQVSPLYLSFCCIHQQMSLRPHIQCTIKTNVSSLQVSNSSRPATRLRSVPAYSQPPIGPQFGPSHAPFALLIFLNNWPFECSALSLNATSLLKALTLITPRISQPHVPIRLNTYRKLVPIP